MSTYKYEELEKVAKAVKAEFIKRGIVIKKRRRKPRDEQKKNLLYEIALARLRKYPPVKKGGIIILPYFYI